MVSRIRIYSFILWILNLRIAILLLVTSNKYFYIENFNEILMKIFNTHSFRNTRKYNRNDIWSKLEKILDSLCRINWTIEVSNLIKNIRKMQRGKLNNMIISIFLLYFLHKCNDVKFFLYLYRIYFYIKR